MSQTTSRFGPLVEKYRADHQHPVNHFLHVFVGWPMVTAVLGAYAFMFTGHFLFEKNTPTILKNPSTPFVIAWAVIKGIFSGSIKQVVGSDKSNQV